MVIIIFIFGLLIGSFLNVCICRMPEKKSVLAPRSHCPNCGYVLKWYDLIPVLSFLILKGKCRKCGQEISAQYSIVEILTALIYLLIYCVYGISLEFWGLIFLSSILIVISFIDLKHQIIPNRLVLAIFLVGIAYSYVNTNISILDSVIGFFVASVPMFLLALASKGGMGGGDIKLMAAVGVFLGWKITILALLLGALSGTIVSLIFILLKKASRKTKIPFGPYLAIGIMVAAIWGDNIINWYIGISGF